MMKIFKFIFCLLMPASCLFASGSSVGGSKGARPVRTSPNVIVILTDDSGYSDLSCFGSQIDTPNLDRLAGEGTVFSHCYNAARCSPTRASLLTGHYPQRVGMGDLGGPKFDAGHPIYRGILDQKIPTVAEVLKPQGYRTLMAGKWHLGGMPEVKPGFWKRWYPGRELTQADKDEQFNGLPMQRGFDRYFGLLDGEGHCFVNPPSAHRYFEGNAPAVIAEPNWYTTDGTTDKAIEYMGEVLDDQEPFFLYLAYQAPHMPLEAPEEVIEKYRKIYTKDSFAGLQRDKISALKKKGMLDSEASWEITKGLASGSAAWMLQTPAPFASAEQQSQWLEELAIHSAMMEIVDRNVGRMLEFLKGKGALDNTLIFYLSDNGAAGRLGRFCNTPYTGSKAQLWEGGTCTPMIAWAPGRVKAGRMVHTAVSVMDLLPTVLEWTGSAYPESFKGEKLPETPGRSLVPVLTGGSLDAPEFLHWDLYGQRSVVYNGRWKLLINPGWWFQIKQRQEPLYELYDLKNDPAETQNLAQEMPEKVEQLLKAQEKWDADYQIIPYSKALEMGLGRK